MTKRESVRANRRGFMKGAAAAGLGAATMGGAGMLAAINNGAKAQGKSIPVGSLVPLTGWAAADAIEFQRGVKMAAEDINAMGGILGRPLEPFFEDTKVMTSADVIAGARRLIDRRGAHAIVNGYNSPSLRAEYDTIADAGIPYLHDNTQIGHYQHIANNPDRYFNIFMSDPAEWYYGPGFHLFIDSLEAKGQWKRPNNRLAIVAGQFDYNVVIAQGIRENAAKHGWEVTVDETVNSPVAEWGPTLVRLRADDPALIAIIHTSPVDLGPFSVQFAQKPTNSLVYMQYGPQLKAYRDIARQSANGIVWSTLIASLQDEIGRNFNNRYRQRFGADSSPSAGGQPYDSMFVWAIAAARAGGSGEPFDLDQNRKVSSFIRGSIYRGVCGTLRFAQKEQAAIAYPAQTNDPSLGMPHQFLQVQDYRDSETVLISPEPYTTGEFVLPPWLA